MLFLASTPRLQRRYHRPSPIPSAHRPSLIAPAIADPIGHRRLPPANSEPLGQHPQSWPNPSWPNLLWPNRPNTCQHHPSKPIEPIMAPNPIVAQPIVAQPIMAKPILAKPIAANTAQHHSHWPSSPSLANASLIDTAFIGRRHTPCSTPKPSLPNPLCLNSPWPNPSWPNQLRPNPLQPKLSLRPKPPISHRLTPIPSACHPSATPGPHWARPTLGGVPVLKMTTASAMPRRPPPLGRTGHPTVTHAPLVHPLVPQPATAVYWPPPSIRHRCHWPPSPIGHSRPSATAARRPQPSIGHSRPSATAVHQPQPPIGHS